MVWNSFPDLAGGGRKWTWNFCNLFGFSGWGLRWGDAVRLVSAVITHTNIEEGGRKIIWTKKINIALIHSLLFPQTTIIICLVSIYAKLSQHIDYLKFLWTCNFPRISGKPRPRNGKLWTGATGADYSHHHHQTDWGNSEV